MQVGLHGVLLKVTVYVEVNVHVDAPQGSEMPVGVGVAGGAGAARAPMLTATIRFSPGSETSANEPSGEIATPQGLPPTATVPTTARVEALMTESDPDPWLATTTSPKAGVGVSLGAGGAVATAVRTGVSTAVAVLALLEEVVQACVTMSAIAQPAASRTARRTRCGITGETGERSPGRRVGNSSRFSSVR